MQKIETIKSAGCECWTDQEIVRQIQAGNTALYEIIMRRYNQRLYRVARAILLDDAEAEDVMQDAYVRAYQHLDQFAGRAPFSAWLTHIAVNEALRRLSLRKRNPQLDESEDGQKASMNIVETSLDPEQSASFSELGRLLEQAVLDLPSPYRTVIMLRDIEELSTSETATVLDLTEQNVKVRLHRGRSMMRNSLFARVGADAKNAFPFMGSRCDRVVSGVFARIGE